MEIQDGLPVTEYQARFSGTFDVDPSFGNDLYAKKVCLWLVAASTGKFEVTPHKDGDDATRKNIQVIEDALPLTGSLRDQAILYLAHGGSATAVDFGSPTDAEIELDRLQQYLLKSWAPVADEQPSASRLVDLVISQLERYKDGEPPQTALSQPPAPSEDVETPPTSLDAEEGAPTPSLTEEELEVIERRLEAELEAETATDEPYELAETPDAGPVDVETLKATLKATMGTEDEEPKRSNLQVGKTAVAYQAAPADGEEVMVLGDDHVVIGSVYGAHHTGKNREYLEMVGS